MIDYSDNIDAVKIKPIRKKKNPFKQAITSVSILNKPEKCKDEKREEEETVIPFDKWIMPPQPEGYMKYPPHDLF